MPDPMTQQTPPVETPDHYRTVDVRFAPQVDPDDKCDVSAFLTVDTVDADNEVVLPVGVDLGRFARNAPVMVCHDWMKQVSYYPLPVGQVVWSKVRPHGILGGIKFGNTPMALEVKSLVLDAILRGVSIGMKILEQSAMTRAEAESRPDWKAAFERAKGKINVIRKCLLMELSVVPIPSNEDALIQTLRAKGMSRPEWVAPANRKEAVMPELVSESVPDPEPLTPSTREDYVAAHPETASVIDGLVQEAVTAAKGVYLGDVRGSSLSAMIDRLSSSLTGYLWSLVYQDQGDMNAVEAKLRGACDEFRDALVTAFQGLEPLRSAPSVQAVFNGIRAYSVAMPDAAKGLFGDPGELIEGAEMLIKSKAPAPVNDEEEDMDDEEDGEDDADNDEDSGPIRKGMFVKCVKGMHRGVVGKVKSIHRSGPVPDVEDDVMSTKSDPACRVQAYKAMGDGHRETEHHVGCKAAHLEKIDDLKPPKKGTKPVTPAKAKALEIEILPGEIRTDAEVQSDRIAAKRAALSPDVLKRIARSVLDEITGAV